MAVWARSEEDVRECDPQPHRLPFRALLPTGHWWYCYRYRRGTVTGTKGHRYRANLRRMYERTLVVLLQVQKGHSHRYSEEQVQVLGRPEEDVRECHPQPHRLPLRALLPPGHWWYCYRYRRGTVTGTEGHRYRYRADLRKMYESVTPNPTGSLSGPYFLQDTGGTVTGTEGAQSQVQRGTGTGTEGHRYRYRANLRKMYERALVVLLQVQRGHRYR
jgi:hypothetical protein